MEALQCLEERLDLEVLKGHHLMVLRMGDLLDSGVTWLWKPRI